ncbi:condensin complex subunit 3-like [Oculina patagonica]
MRFDSVTRVFEKAQRGFQHHNKLLTELKKLHDKSSQDEFQKSFVWHLKHAMVVFNREPAVERVIEFVANYTTLKDHRTSQVQKDGQASDGEEDDTSNVFLDFIFTFLLDSHEAQDKAVRFRVCQLINKLLNNLDDDAVIDDDLAERIFESMLTRLHDKIPAVRVQAVAAISRLQDPSDPECIVMSTYLKLMSNDTSAEVRRAVLLNIALSSQTLEGIIERTQDVTDSVRKLAYRILADKVSIKSLTIAQRVQLLSNGLHDRSKSIQDAFAKELLSGWLKSFDKDVIKLLKCLDVEGCIEVAELALKTILKGLPKEDLPGYVDTLKKGQEEEGPVRISYEALDVETAFYWRCLGEHFKSMGVDGEELLDDLLPEVSEFCKYIQGYVDSFLCRTAPEHDHSEVQQIFIARQLLTLMGVVDLSDEVGRKNLCQLIHDLLVLPEIPESLVGILHTRYIDVQPEETNRIQELVEIIADVRQPIVMFETAQNKEEKRQWELKVAGIRVKLNQFRDEMEQCVSNQDFGRAAELKQQIAELEEQKEILDSEENSFSQTVREEKDDPDTLLKCLTIASEMLQGVATNGLNPTLTTLVQTLILPGVQNEDPSVRNMAVKCLGLCALLSCEFARTHLVLFLQVAQLDQEIVRVTALQVVFGLLLTFGLEAFRVNAAVPELKHDEPSTTGEEQDNSGNEDNENEEGDDDSEKSDEDDVEESQAPDTDTAASVLTILTGLLESESNDLRNVAAEGLAKLLLAGRVLSAKLFSRLLLLWYNPTTEDDVNLRHCLGVFFPVFAFASSTNQELVEEAFLPTLKTLFSAPVSSPLASVNINNVAELLVDLTNSKYLEKGNSVDTSKGSSIHASLSLAVANEILSSPSAPGVRMLCKILTMMDLTGCSQSTVKEIKVLSTMMINHEEIEDGASAKSLNKFQKMLQILTDSENDVSQTEPEDSQQVNAEETEDINEDKTNDTTTVNGTDTRDQDRLEGNNCPPQDPESTEHTGCNTDETETLTEETSTVLNKTQTQNKPPKTKSRTKSRKQGTKSTTRDTELSPSSVSSEETPARRTRSSRKSKSDASKKFKSMIDSEDENSEKENVSSNDAEDVFN